MQVNIPEDQSVGGRKGSLNIKMGGECKDFQEKKVWIFNDRDF